MTASVLYKKSMARWSLLLSYLSQECLRIFPSTICIMGVTETGPLQVVPYFVYALERGPRSITFLQQLTQHDDELGQLLVWESCCQRQRFLIGYNVPRKPDRSLR